MSPIMQFLCIFGKIIYSKYSKNGAYTLTHTIDCVCSKMLNNGITHGLFLLLFQFFKMKIHYKLNEFRIKKTRLLFCFRFQFFT